MNLEELAIKYGTDKKCSGGHGYTPVYEQFFESRRNDNINFMELGVREGWSIRMWEEYFSEANIYCIDNNLEGLCPSGFDSPRIHFTLCSQTDEKALNDIATTSGGFDIIIDDASHISSLSIKSFEILFPHIRKNGIYVFEDLHVCHLPIYNPEGVSVHQYINSLVNSPDKKMTYFNDNKICVVEKI